MSSDEEAEADARREFVEIDLSSVGTSDELHALLLHSLDFPGWYGCNWNAFWDAITGLVQMPIRLRLIGWQQFEKQLPWDAEWMRKCITDMATQYPEWASEVEYV